MKDVMDDSAATPLGGEMQNGSLPADPHQGRTWDDLRTGMRFPLNIPAVVLAGGREANGMTVNISAGGILLRLSEQLPVEDGFEFLLHVPKEDLDNESSAAIHCVGRSIRTYEQDGFCFIAAIIDEYRFQ